ncbi:hypothetical protein CRUP_000967 [Coryphaenoides rupestris]|nr:hypothetical protein CRUP_000967 [Coryphaenoides rupestris]
MAAVGLSGGSGRALTQGRVFRCFSAAVGAYGDYPQLPDKSQQERDPWYRWDHPDLRRNWGEPMHWDFDLYIRNRVDTSPTVVPWATMTKQLLGFLGFMMFMFYMGEQFKAYQPTAPKQFPYNNLYLEKGNNCEVGHLKRKRKGKMRLKEIQRTAHQAYISTTTRCLFQHHRSA